MAKIFKLFPKSTASIVVIIVILIISQHGAIMDYISHLTRYIEYTIQGLVDEARYFIEDFAKSIRENGSFN